MTYLIVSYINCVILKFCVINFRIGYQRIYQCISIIFIFILLVPQLLNGVLLPKRIISQIGSKLKLPNYSSFELDEAFNLGKDKVVQKLRLENDLIKDGK